MTTLRRGSKDLMNSRQVPHTPPAAAAAAAASVTPPFMVGDAIDYITEQCQCRGLDDTASWLSALALDATPSVLEEVLSRSCALTAACEIDAVLRPSPLSMMTASSFYNHHARVLSSSSSGVMGEASADNTRVEGTRHQPLRGQWPYGDLPSASTCQQDILSAMERAAVLLRVRRHHRMALSLFHKGEFHRCHYLLTKALREFDGDQDATATTAAERRAEDNGGREEKDRGEGEETRATATGTHTPSPQGQLQQQQQQRQATAKNNDKCSSKAAMGQAAEDDLDAELRASLFSVSFASSTLPAALQFLCLYALYMDGQKIKSTSGHHPHHQHRSMNPHLRVLRGLLLDALQNPSNAVPSSATAAAMMTSGGGFYAQTDTQYRRNDGDHDEEAGGGDQRGHLRRRWSGEGGRSVPPSASLSSQTPTRPAGDSSLAAATMTSAAVGSSFSFQAGGEGGSSSEMAHANTGIKQPSSSFRAAGATSMKHAKGGGYAAPAFLTATSATGVVGEGGSPALSQQDPYLCWLMGVVLNDLGMRQESATYLLAAVSVNPLLWCAWEDLTTLVSREAQLEELEALIAGCEPNFMAEIFLAYAKAALGVTPLSFRSPSSSAGAGTDAGGGQPSAAASPSLFSTQVAGAAPTAAMGVETSQSRTVKNSINNNIGTTTTMSSAVPRLVNTWELLLSYFPRSLFLQLQLARYHYHKRKELDKAEKIYAQVQRTDPYRLDGVADYSNILFIRGDRLGLSGLAQRVYQVDPFRAESNFVVGNFYVLLGQHERSVLHFKRAVAIDPRFVAAWTLLGHAYVETKNTTAAVEAYRTAVDLDQRDYRGWYNLGQLYELLQAYHHALYYYWHTTTLRPSDPRMWSAVANCLEHDGRYGESVACYERAELYEPPTSELYPGIVRRIATYYVDRRNFARACVFLEKLARSPAASDEDRLFALPFLVQYYAGQAQQVMELPARSPSYEPTTAAGGGSSPATTGGGGAGRPFSPSSSSPYRQPQYAGGSSPQHHGMIGAAAGVGSGGHDRGGGAGHQVEQALAHLTSAEAYLDALEAAVMPAATFTTGVSGSSPGTSGGGARRGDVEDILLGNMTSGLTPSTAAARSTLTQVARFIAHLRRDVALNRRLIQQHRGAD